MLFFQHLVSISRIGLICGLLIVTLSACDDVIKRESATGKELAAHYAFKKHEYGKAIEYYEQALGHTSNDEDVLRQLYGLYMITGQYDRAVKRAKQHIQSYPEGNILFAQLVLAVNDINQLDFINAQEYILGLMAKDSVYQQAPFGKLVTTSLSTWATVGRGNQLKAFKELLASPENPEFKDFVIYQQAILLEMAGETARAKRLIKQLASRHSSFEVVQLAYSFYVRNGFLLDAKKLKNEYESKLPILTQGYDEATYMQPAYVTKDKGKTAQYMLSSMFSQVGTLLALAKRYNDAILYYRLALWLGGQKDSVQMLLAGIYEEMGESEKAIDLYATVTKDSRLYRPAREELARITNAIGNTSKATALLETMRMENPNQADVFLNFGDMMVANKDYKSAALYYEKALAILREQFPAGLQQRHWPVLYALAICYEQTDRWDAAEALFFEALELSPREPEVLNYLAYSWLLQDRNYEKARVMLEKAVTQRPQAAHILDSYGWVLYKLGDYDQALFFLETANKLIPYDASTNDHVGDLYWKLGRKLEAQYMWERALTFDPEEEQAARIKQKLKEGLDSDIPVRTPVLMPMSDAKCDADVSTC